MSVVLSCRTSAGTPWRAHLRARARQLQRALGLSGCELSVILVDDAAIRALNRAYRGVDRPTDVLAFPLHEQHDGSALRGVCTRGGLAARLAAGGPAARLLGDVVISIDTAAAQARACHGQLAARLDALLIHGVLHLLGYDHEVSAVEARRMARRARTLRAVLADEPSAAGRRSLRARQLGWPRVAR
jgi:rRNA maturation RNase YbeY